MYIVCLFWPNIKMRSFSLVSRSIVLIALTIVFLSSISQVSATAEFESSLLSSQFGLFGKGALKRAAQCTLAIASDQSSKSSKLRIAVARVAQRKCYRAVYASTHACLPNWGTLWSQAAAKAMGLACPSTRVPIAM